MDNLDQRLERASDCHIHTPIGSDGRTEIQDLLPEISKLDLACITDHNNIVWKEWYPLLQQINKNKEHLTYTMPGAEVSLQHKGKTVHIVIYFTKRENNLKDMHERIKHTQDTLLREINDRIIDKFDLSLEKAINHFKHIPKKYQLSRDLILETRWPHLIQGHDAVGFYYTDIIKAMNEANERMLKDNIIQDPEQGYGTKYSIESYFHKRKSEFDPKTQGIFLADYNRMPCEEAMPLLSDTADIIGIAHASSRHLVEEFKGKNWINAIGFVDLSAKDLMILPGSDYHGGPFRKEKIGYDKGNKLPSCVQDLKDKGFYLFS